MRSIGIRELRQHASRHLRDVEAGETLEITDRGRPVARLVPVITEEPLRGVAKLRAEGRVIEATGRLQDLPAPAPRRPGERPLSEVLAEMRDDERS